MAWNLSTGLQQALLGGQTLLGPPLYGEDFQLESSTTGRVSLKKISGGLQSFAEHDFIRFLQGTNRDVVAKVLSVVSDTELTLDGASILGLYSGKNGSIAQEIRGGGLPGVLRNSLIVGYTGARPANADSTETGTKLFELTLNGDAFSAGVSVNGLNLVLDGTTVKRALQAGTSNRDVWRGIGLATDNAGWCRWYANDYTTGASSTAIRMDGTIGSLTGDLILSAGVSVIAGTPIEVNDVDFTLTGG